MKITIAFLLCAAIAIAQDCSAFNTIENVTFGMKTNAAEHTAGYHYFVNHASGGCEYTGRAGSRCAVTSTSNSSSVAAEGPNSALTTARVHEVGTKDANGYQSAAAGGSAVSDAEGVGAAVSCLISCTLNITITGTGKGGGFSYGVAPSALWSSPQHSGNSCPAQTAPAC